MEVHLTVLPVEEVLVNSDVMTRVDHHVVIRFGALSWQLERVQREVYVVERLVDADDALHNAVQKNNNFKKTTILFSINQS